MCTPISDLSEYQEPECDTDQAISIKITKDMSNTDNTLFTFSTIGIMAMCDCSLSSMALDKMPYLIDNQIPEQLEFNVILGDAQIST